MIPRINTELLARFITCRLTLGIPTKTEIIKSIQRTSTHSLLPPGWQYR